MKLFPAKISERATLQNLLRQRVAVHCYPRMFTDDHRYSEVLWISSFKTSSFIINHLKTGPTRNKIFWKQNILFPSGPVVRCLRACLHGGGGPQVVEVTRLGGVTRLSILSLIWSPHLSCKRNQIKMRDYIDRRVTPPKQVTSPTWGPLPPCKQALIWT